MIEIAMCRQQPLIPNIFIIILNWNGWKDTIECIESIQQLHYENYRIIVVDNGSTDDSWNQLQAWARLKLNASGRYKKDLAEAIGTIIYDRDTAENGGISEKECLLTTLPSPERIVLIKSMENLGFSCGFNIAIQYALKAGSDYIWLLNNDTIVLPDTLERLIDFFEKNPAYQGATSQIRYYDQPDHVWNCGGHLKWYGVPRYIHADSSIANVPQSGFEHISFMTGCAPIFRSQLFKTVGLLSDRYFWGTEDIEFAQRLKKAGKAIACVYDSIIYHKVSRSLSEEHEQIKMGIIYFHYLGVFINMRHYWPKHIWLTWRLLYSIYIFRLIVMKYKYPFRKARVLIRALLNDSRVLDKVDRTTFEYAKKEKFFTRYKEVA